MFSSLFAQVQRTLLIFWLVVMVFVVSLPPHSSLLFRRRDKPRLLPDKIMRSRNLTPTVRGIGGRCILCHDGFYSNGGKQRENLLPPRSIRSDETRLFFVRDLGNDAHARKMRPVSAQASPDVTQLHSLRNAHFVQPARHFPLLESRGPQYVLRIFPRDRKSTRLNSSHGYI